jgi:hypothetical protein
MDEQVLAAEGSELDRDSGGIVNGEIWSVKTAVDALWALEAEHADAHKDENDGDIKGDSAALQCRLSGKVQHSNQS